METYHDIYDKMSDTDLQKILENPQEYESAVVEEVKSILHKRGVNFSSEQEKDLVANLLSGQNITNSYLQKIHSLLVGIEFVVWGWFISSLILGIIFFCIK